MSESFVKPPGGWNPAEAEEAVQPRQLPAPRKQRSVFTTILPRPSRPNSGQNSVFKPSEESLIRHPLASALQLLRPIVCASAPVRSRDPSQSRRTITIREHSLLVRPRFHRSRRHSRPGSICHCRISVPSGSHRPGDSTSWPLRLPLRPL